jgi:type IV pilus assembly protein PilM
VIDFHLFRPRARQLAGLDISSSSVKLVELSGSAEGYRLDRYAIEPLAREAVVDGNIVNLESVGESIRRALRRMGGGVKQVAVALPASAVITKKIVLQQGLREQEMEFQVESEANQYIPFAIDEVNLDFQIVGPSPAAPDDVEVLIAASRKEKVEDRVAVAEAAGLKAVVMDVESFAAEAAFELINRPPLDGTKGRIVALVDIGSITMSVTILRDGRQIYTREQSIGGSKLTQDIVRQYGLSVEEAEAGKKTGSLPDGYERDLVRPFMDSLALEVARALQFFFTSTQYNEVHQIVLAGGCAVMPRLVEVIAGRTQVPATVANPFADMTLSSRIRPANLLADAPGLLVACGLALRKFDPS